MRCTGLSKTGHSLSSRKTEWGPELEAVGKGSGGREGWSREIKSGDLASDRFDMEKKTSVSRQTSWLKVWVTNGGSQRENIWGGTVFRRWDDEFNLGPVGLLLGLSFSCVQSCIKRQFYKFGFLIWMSLCFAIHMPRDLCHNSLICFPER